jgi:hypothetical protein
MKEIFLYFRLYFQEVDKKVWLLTTSVVAILVFLNYSIGIEQTIKSFPSAALRLTAFFLLYAFTFITCYVIRFHFSGSPYINQKPFVALLILCPLIFAAKISLNIPELKSIFFAPWSKYWQIIINWPLKCILIISVIYGIWRWHRYMKPVAGMNRTVNWKPYLLLLFCAVPLLAVASTMDDFQRTYPKLKNISFIYPYSSNDFVCKLLYELSYGTDFLTIEAFFRGFVVLAFVRYVGKDSILPMAAFYCTIHFGKPLFECITSYIGGIMLGIIVYNTKSIWGGLIVHLGIAWLMEASALISAN